MHTVYFQVGNRFYEVEATNGTLQDLIMGPHDRQKEIQRADLSEPVDRRPPQANGELKGVTLRWPVTGPPPFSRKTAA